LCQQASKMIQLEPKIIEHIREIIRKIPTIEKVVIFGSRAKGSARPGSDIDLALMGDHITMNELIKMGRMLDDLDLPNTFDLVIYKFIKNPDLKEQIDKVGIEI
jgi:uncharacterized protein